VTFLQRAILVLVLVCLGCSAQSAAPEVARRIEQQVRTFYNIPPNVKINLSALKPSEFPNYDALTITFDGGEKKQTYEFLLARDGKTLLRMTKLDLSKDPFAEIMKKIDVSSRPTRGDSKAKVIAVNYDDFECPFCSRMHQTLFPQLLKEYGDRVVFIYKDYPLAEIHPWATHAAVNANCLASQNKDAYWDFADYIHANQSEVNAEKTHDAQFALGVEATPTLFVNGEKVDGALPISELRAVLDRALVQAGVPAPAHPVSASTGVPQPAGK